MGYVFRWATPVDDAVLADIMFDAVRSGPSKYTEAQRNAWVPTRREGQSWHDRLAGQYIVIAEKDGQALGFMSLVAGGYIDFAYIRPAAQGTGLFRKLFDQIEAQAATIGENHLWVHASLAAEPAFTSVGFTIRRQETLR